MEEPWDLRFRHPELVEGSVQLQPLPMIHKASRTALWIFVALALIGVLTPARSEDDAQINEALWLTDHAKLENKVKTLVIGDVDLKNVTVDQALDFLRSQTKLTDPDHQGINFVPDPDQPELKTIKFNVKLRNATVEKVLQQFPMIRYSIGDITVDLRMELEGGLCSRTFHVPDNVLAINPSMISDKNKQIYDVRPLFAAKGIEFPPGTSAIYALPAKSLTVVTVDPDDLIRIDELLVYGFKAIK